MSTRHIPAVLGGIAIILASIGAVTSISVVRAGNVEGGVYLTVNILLASIGIALLVRGLRRRAPKRSMRTTRNDGPDACSDATGSGKSVDGPGLPGF